MIFTKKWWKACVIRMLKTAGQVFVATIPTSTVLLNEVNWAVIGSTVVMSSIASFCTSLAGLPEANETNETNESEAKNG